MVHAVRPIHLQLPALDRILCAPWMSMWRVPGACRYVLGYRACRMLSPLVSRADFVPLPVQTQPSGAVEEPGETWKPWPAHPAFIDEVHRWWPSDDFPPEEPEIVIEDRRPDRLPEFVLWPYNGGLLDTWA